MMCSRGDSPRWRRGQGGGLGPGSRSRAAQILYCPQSCYLCQFLGDPTSPCGGQGGELFTWPRCLEAWGPRGRKSPARLCGRKRAPRLCLPSRASPSSTGATSEAAFWPEGAPSSERALRLPGHQGDVDEMHSATHTGAGLRSPRLVEGSRGDSWILRGPALSPLPHPHASRTSRQAAPLPRSSAGPVRCPEGRAPWALSGLPSALGTKLLALGKAGPCLVDSQAQRKQMCACPGRG